MALSDRFAADLLSHSIDLSRFSASVQLKILGLLDDLARDLEAKIRRWDLEGVTRVTFKRRRAERLIDDIDQTISRHYRTLNKTHAVELVALGRVEAKALPAIVNQVIGVDLFSIKLDAGQLRALTRQDLVVGGPAKEWWRHQGRGSQMRFATEIRNGVAAGETNEQLVRRIRGRATGTFRRVEKAGKTISVRNFTGGVLDISTRHAETLVRTSVLSVSNGVLAETWKQNADILRGQQALATLDGKTSFTCVSRAGAIWDINTGRALPESPYQAPFPGPPPWHFNCRTIIIPVTKSWAILVEESTGRRLSLLEGLPSSTRASMNGQVAVELSTDAFIRGQGDAWAREYLGAGRFELWDAGRITTTQLVDQTGRPATLDRLRRIRKPRPMPMRA